MAYLIDANVFIQAKNLHYGFDFCPAFWDWLTSGNRASKLFSIEKVGDELKAGDDQLEEWAKARGAGFFVPPDKPVVGALATVSTWVHGQSFTPASGTLPGHSRAGRRKHDGAKHAVNKARNPVGAAAASGRRSR